MTLRKKQLLEKLLPLVDGVIVGSLFTSSYDSSIEDIETICNYIKTRGKKVYIVMDDFVSEDELPDLYYYFRVISKLDVDGIYFHDFGIYDIARKDDMVSKLIYDGKTVLCNALDTAFLLKRGIDSVVLSRELTLEEITNIVKANPKQVDLQIFGHTRLSYSKREFLKNYFNEINREYDYLNKETMSLVEEQRDYRLPIIENGHGTYIYSDYVFEMFNEINDLKKYLKRGIIDTLFIDDSTVMEVCRDYRRTSNENKEFLKQNLLQSHPDNYSSGYLYQRTNITKDE